MASEENKDLINRYLPHFWNSLFQVVIQSRLGEKAFTISKSPAKGSTMFNLEINMDEEIAHSIKKYMGGQIISPDNSVSIEILLRTKDGDVMVLEVWTLSVDQLSDSSPQKISQVITDRLSILLKSTICISRITPAYGLSFRQGYETFVILYRLYFGTQTYDCLGENYSQVKVGQANICNHCLNVCLAYRTVLTFPTRPKSASYEQMMLKSDHFKADSSPIYQRRMVDRCTDSSDTGPTSDESHDATRLPFNTQMDLHSASPRSRTSSDSSNRGPFSNIHNEKIHVPFASSNSVKASSLLDECTDEGSLPFSNLLVSAALERNSETHTQRQQYSQEHKEKYEEPETSSISSESSTKVIENPIPSISPSRIGNSSVITEKSKKNSDFVVVNLKTPFVGSNEGGDLELSTFFREWQAAPPLKLFSDPAQSFDAQASLSDQIHGFETCANDFDDLVKSLHIDDDQASQEFG